MFMQHHKDMFRVWDALRKFVPDIAIPGRAFPRGVLAPLASGL